MSKQSAATKRLVLDLLLKSLRRYGLSFRFLIIVLVISIVSIGYYVYSTKNSSSESVYKVIRVIDGDTIEVEKDSIKLTVRYIGIDTPETVKPNTKVECFGKEASEFNKELVLGKEVILEADAQDTDRYGRALRYVYIEQGGELIMVNRRLVEDGYAQAASYPPNVKYQDIFRDLQNKARDLNKGLWKGCGSTLGAIGYFAI